MPQENQIMYKSEENNVEERTRKNESTGKQIKKDNAHVRSYVYSLATESLEDKQ